MENDCKIIFSRNEIENYKILKQFEVFETYPTVFIGFCRRVFTKSRGWNITVEHVPDIAPAAKDLKTGF